jgi:hypothetical protein
MALDTFEGYTVGNLNGQGSWVTGGDRYKVSVDPTNASNKVWEAISGGTGDYARKALASLAIADGTTGTLFLRFRYVAAQDYAWGLSDEATPTTSFGSFEVQSGNAPAINPDAKGDVNFGARDGSTSDLLGKVQIVTNPQWHSVWYVVDSVNNQTSIYIQGGYWPSQTSLSDTGLDPTFTFRNGATNANALVTFLARRGGYMLDDIYIDTTGQNLTNPVPEPAVAGASALCALGLLARRRRA